MPQRQIWLILACAAILLGVLGGVAIGLRFALSPPPPKADATSQTLAAPAPPPR